MSDETARDGAGVLAPPPLIYLAAILPGVGIGWLVGGSIAPGSVLRLALGLLLIASGTALLWSFFRRFRASGQHPHPDAPTPSIITAGPYRFSRNPAYVGMTAITAGIGLALDNPWVLLLLIPALVLMQVGVIRREEAYLERKFGEEYLRYKGSVRRWV